MSNQNKYKIMLVDDEEAIGRIVGQLMQKEGYAYCYAPSGEMALRMFAGEQPDLVILDIMMPDMDGFELCQKIRETSKVPIIMLSAKEDIVDKKVAYNMGADDYVTKPFSTAELALRIKAVLRMVSGNRQEKADPAVERSLIQVGDLVINSKSYEVTLADHKVDFTAKEFDLLWFMATHPGQVFTRKQLFDALWNENYNGDPASITVFIRKIRDKIEQDSAHPEYILTIWGVGYKFVG